MERGKLKALSWKIRGVLYFFLTFAGAIQAQELTEEQFVETSLRDRTALHYDPLLDPPLESLVKLYQGVERVDELIGLYKSHVTQYPEDAGAKTVLIRILRKVDRAGADELIASAVPLHPNFAPLQYILFRFLEERGDARATEALSLAIDLETNPARRYAWLDQLLKLSEGEATRKLAEIQFNKLFAVENQSVEMLLGLARLMQRYQFWDLSVAALNKAKAAKLDPEAAVEVEIMLATAQAQLGNRLGAGKILDALLGRLAPDHWRRPEIMSLRVSVIATEEERLAMLASLEAAYRKNPRSEAAVLAYADVLIAGEKMSDAISVLLNASTLLPKSALIEARTLELLESSPDTAAYAPFLEQRLESEPGRIDLRFRLVKANYALRKDAAAEQDFKAVVAGLQPDEISSRILELQRYLRLIDRIDVAAPYLDRYVRNHPTRLDVARELAEVYLAIDAPAGVEDLVRRLNPKEADVTNVRDFAEFLLEKEFFNAARTVVTAKLAVEPKDFELGLLLTQVLGRMGDVTAANQQIALVREMADTVPRYSRWLKVAVETHRILESLPGFFESEQNRFNFTDGVWSEDKVERFLILCEAGKQQLFTEGVTSAIRDQIAQPGMAAPLRLRLRRFLVGILERNPDAASEAEEQLKLLATEDPGNKREYDLRRALVYHRSQRADLAQGLVDGIDLAQITDASLLRVAGDMFVEYGLLEEADSALSTINRLEPGDLLSWERRLLVLVTLRHEPIFRSVIRSLRNGEAGVKLRELSNQSLEEHLGGSYWRSISAMMASGENEVEAILPLLASAARENLTIDFRLWSEWTRALVLTRLGRTEEATEAIEGFRSLAKTTATTAVNFPDGLVLSVDAASDFLSPRPNLAAETAVPTADFLLNGLTLSWAFELPSQRKIHFFNRSGNSILVVDDHGTVYALDGKNGKLIWRHVFSEHGGIEHLPRPSVFDDVTVPNPIHQASGEKDLMGKAPRAFSLSGERFFLLRDGEFQAFSVLNGSLLWTAQLPPGEKTSGAQGSRAEIVFAVEDGHAIVFNPATQALFCFETSSGKLLWNLSIGEVPTKNSEGLYSLNSGITLKEGRVFVYGWDSAIIDVASGKRVWSFNGAGSSDFPIILREDRGEKTGGAVDLVDRSIGNRLFDFQARDAAGSLKPAIFLSAPSSLVGPGVFWAKQRIRLNEASFAEISGSYLLLMQEGGVRRISTRLPVASRELPASGTFLGQSGSHVWFFDGDFLHHLDFYRERTSRLSIRDLGDPATVRSVMIGNQLLIRGSQSMKLVNALSGEVIGQSPLPPGLMDYLERSSLTEPDEALVRSIWQGRIYRGGPGQPGYCLPMSDLVSEGQYITAFGQRAIVSLVPAKPIVPAAAPK